MLAAAGSGVSVRFWDMDEGRPLDSLEVEGDMAKTVAFAPAGRLLAVGEWSAEGSSAVSLWDWRDRRLVEVLGGHRGGINVLAFTADGERLASGDSAGVVKLWEVATRRERASLAVCQWGTAVAALALSPDGTRLATAGHFESEVRLWDVPSGRRLGTFPGMETAVNGLAFSPDGTMLAVARQDGTAVILDGTLTRARARSGPGPGRSRPWPSPTTAGRSPPGARTAVCGSGTWPRHWAGRVRTVSEYAIVPD